MSEQSQAALSALDAPAPVGLTLQRAGVLVPGQPIVSTPPPVLRREEEARVTLVSVITDQPPPVRVLPDTTRA